MLCGEEAGEASELHDLIALDVTRRRDRVGHPPGHLRESARSLTELLGGVLVEYAALVVSVEGALAGSHGSVVGPRTPTFHQRNGPNAQGVLTESPGRSRPGPIRAQPFETIRAIATTARRASTPFSMFPFYRALHNARST